MFKRDTPSLDIQNTTFSFYMPPHEGHSPSEPFLSFVPVVGRTDVMIHHATKQTGLERKIAFSTLQPVVIVSNYT